MDLDDEKNIDYAINMFVSRSFCMDDKIHGIPQVREHGTCIQHSKGARFNDPVREAEQKSSLIPSFNEGNFLEDFKNNSIS
jgi:hypothetical protein